MTDILSMFDETNDAFDPDNAPADAFIYLNGRSKYDLDVTVQTAKVNVSKNPATEGKKKIIFEVCVDHAASGETSDGEEYKEGDVISIMIDLEPANKFRAKNEFKDLAALLTACTVDGSKNAEVMRLNADLAATASSKSKLEDLVGEDAMAFATKGGKGYQVSGLYRLFANPTALSGAKIKLQATGEPNDAGYYKRAVERIEPICSMDDLRSRVAS